MGLFKSITSAIVNPIGTFNNLGSNFLGDTFGDSLSGIPFIGDGIKQKFAREQFDYQKIVDNRNFANQDRSFAEQQYLNRNGMTLQAAQAQKMGMNPMAISMGSSSTASATPVSSNASASSPSSSSAGLIGTIISSLIGSKSSKEIAQINADSAEKVAETNAEATKKAAEIHAGASNYNADKNYEGTTYSADSQRIGAWERLVEEQNNLNLRNSANIASAEKIAKGKVDSVKMNQVLDILKYNREAERDYIKDKAKVLSDMYEYFRARGAGISQKGFDDWFSSTAYNASVYAKNFFDALTPSALKRMNRDEFTDWFQKNFEFAPFKPINIDEYINSYKDLK